MTRRPVRQQHVHPLAGVSDTRCSSFCPLKVPQVANGHVELKEIVVTGWKESKAASNDDGGIGALVAFLERRGTMNYEKWIAAKGINTGRTFIKIKKVG